jgi:hypothetical protein
LRLFNQALRFDAFPAASSLSRFALKTPKNRLQGDFLPCKLLSGFSRKQPVYRGFCGTK